MGRYSRRFDLLPLLQSWYYRFRCSANAKLVSLIAVILRFCPVDPKATVAKLALSERCFVRDFTTKKHERRKERRMNIKPIRKLTSTVLVAVALAVVAMATIWTPSPACAQGAADTKTDW